ncbi:L,D-transpeptidase family protein [Anatilimnocola sp. NA78]|uniref:L,D-transpeptidase n=1 Tax=Anatilimnocola sp. NA78 TaxID=3415683 RepID=UPI003CE5537E
MNSLKSTCVILVLAGVLYGVYVTLNAPDKSPSGNFSQQQLAEMKPPAIDFGSTDQAPGVVQAPFLTPAAPPPGAPPANAAAGFAIPDRSVPPLVDIADHQHTQPAPFTAPAPAPEPAPPVYEAPASTAPYPAPAATTQPTVEVSSDPPTADATSTSPSIEAFKLKRAWTNVERHVQDGKFRDALVELSPFATNPHLAHAERTQLLTWLDALAGKVIYSNEHLLAEPYRVQGRSQTLYDVSSMYKVDAQLLMNINAAVVKDSAVLIPGTELKVIPGPFRAEINLAAGELTLFLGQLYAGRFSFTVGDERPSPGVYQVREKSRDKTYIGRDGRQLAATDPANPYGGWWIDLGSNVSLHGSGTAAGLGCVSFSPQDAQDLASILSLNSEVTIKP